MGNCSCGHDDRFHVKVPRGPFCNKCQPDGPVIVHILQLANSWNFRRVGNKDEEYLPTFCGDNFVRGTPLWRGKKAVSIAGFDPNHDWGGEICDECMENSPIKREVVEDIRNRTQSMRYRCSLHLD